MFSYECFLSKVSLFEISVLESHNRIEFWKIESTLFDWKPSIVDKFFSSRVQKISNFRVRYASAAGNPLQITVFTNFCTKRHFSRHGRCACICWSLINGSPPQAPKFPCFSLFWLRLKSKQKHWILNNTLSFTFCQNLEACNDSFSFGNLLLLKTNSVIDWHWVVLMWRLKRISCRPVFSSRARAKTTLLPVCRPGRPRLLSTLYITQQPFTHFTCPRECPKRPSKKQQ